MLELNRTQTQMVVDTLDVAVIIYDKDLKPLKINQTFKKLFSVPTSPASTIDHYLNKLSVVNSSQENMLLKANQLTTPQSKTLLVMEEKTSKHYLELTVKELPELIPDMAYIASFRDVTNETLDRLHRLRFIKVVSHELKNPLSCIKAYSYYFKKYLTDAPPEIKAHLTSLDKQVEILNQLLNDLTDTSKLSLHQLDLDLELLSLNSLLEKTIEDLRIVHPSRTIHFSQHQEAEVIADPKRLRQVFTNLIDNAVKYSPEASAITVDLDSHDSEAQVNITDHGKGIDQQFLDKIFDPYYRVENPETKAIKGLGLGLFLTKEIVEQHEGKLSVESTPNQGSTFSVKLPIYQEE